MSRLLRRPAPVSSGTIVEVTPASAGWEYVGFEAVALAPGETVVRSAGAREVCVVVISGRVHVSSEHGDWRDLGVRPDPFSGPPEAAYLPPGSTVTVEGAAGASSSEIGFCFAPASTGAEPAALRAGDLAPAQRGYDRHERTVTDIVMGNRPAERLLVCEVITPSGNWSSYPPHKHDVDDLPRESLLEETYYHRVLPDDCFALQRVYTDDRSLDETVAVHDRDTVLVPRGYHTVAAPPGVSVYYLNVMAGPSREWSFNDDPALAWTRADGATTGGRMRPDVLAPDPEAA
jgi:5-deoxy-glucuronate isomerase